MDDLAPVVVGVGRLTERPGAFADASAPLQLMAKAARLAAADSGVADPAALLKSLAAVAVPDPFTSHTFRQANGLPGPYMRTQGLPYRNLPRSVARAVGATPPTAGLWHCWMGGNSPQYCVNHAAEAIAAGRVRGPVLVAGAEALASLEKGMAEGWHYKKAGKGDPAKRMESWVDVCAAGPDGGGREQPLFINADIDPFCWPEIRHGLVSPPLQFSVLEIALQHKLGRTRAEHGAAMARLLSGLSEVGARDPVNSWFPKVRTVDEIASVSSSNRMVAGQYTKKNCPTMSVNQGAALIVMSRGEARRLGVPDEKVVYLHASADGFSPGTGMYTRASFDDVPEMRATLREVVRAAGVTEPAREIDYFDLYSCFPVAVTYACEYLGIDPETVDASRLTQTGGLPFHGGPGNNYVTHSIAAMVEKLRSEPGKRGLITALGGECQKHSAGVYGTAPPKQPYRRRPLAEYAAGVANVPAANNPDGMGVVDGYTMDYKKDGSVKTVIVIGRMVGGNEDGRRFIANSVSNVDWWLAGSGVIGTRGKVTSKGKNVVFAPLLGKM
eukprot:TRINITY_DN43397_c0_g1_i1.p1 TRINITY_DN43397_c0_g1~~TRINITY_DN43397_c0_g1_i1.p1  ORF type:complete len:555 (+),score=143.00 TRINITY_DN43397_c0_g1_i1:49-1713(+)